MNNTGFSAETISLSGNITDRSTDLQSKTNSGLLLKKPGADLSE